MKPKFILAICCGGLLVGAATAGDQDVDPFADPASNQKPQPVNPAEAKLKALIEKLGPRSNGMGVSSNDDGTLELVVYLHDNPDLSVLRGAPVRDMEIMGSMPLLAAGKIIDLAPLAGLPLESLDIWKVPLNDLTPLKSTRLKKLQIMGAAITDVSPLKDLPLTSLELWCTDVSDISPLKGMRLKL